MEPGSQYVGVIPFTRSRNNGAASTLSECVPDTDDDIWAFVPLTEGESVSVRDRVLDRVALSDTVNGTLRLARWLSVAVAFHVLDPKWLNVFVRVMDGLSAVSVALTDSEGDGELVPLRVSVRLLVTDKDRVSDIDRDGDAVNVSDSLTDGDVLRRG